MSRSTSGQRDSAVRTFKPYPAYKDSGVEWVGEIPAHCVLAPVYSRYQVDLGKMLDAKRVTGVHTGRYLRNVDVQWDRVNVEGLPEMDFAPSERTRYRLREGDILVCEGGEVGRAAIWLGALQECFYQKAIHRIRPRTEQEQARFFYYLMYSFAKRGLFVAGGNPNTIDHLPAVQLRHYRFPFAPSTEQRAIGTFLDRETRKIDAMVAKKERLIELLAEERTAIITRAVTGGLDSTVPTKDTGVEWLGKVPAHWEVARSKRLFGLRRMKALPSDKQLTASQEHGVILQEDFISREGRRVVQVLTGGEILKHVEPNDFVISMRSFQGGIELSRTRGAISSAYVVLTPSAAVHPRYFSYLLKSRRYVQALQSTSNLVRDGQALRYENFCLVDLPSLPLGEQATIGAFLDRKTARISALAKKVRDAIDFLKEFRTALISAAVTGKIDVRGNPDLGVQISD